MLTTYDHDTVYQLPPATLAIFCSLLFASWLGFNALFFCCCQRSFLRTFFNLEAGPEYANRVYWESGKDELRALVLTRIHWSKHRMFKEAAEEWLLSKWTEWEEVPPAWFTPKWQAQLPENLLSDQLKALMRGKKTRRSTVLDQLGEDLEQIGLYRPSSQDSQGPVEQGSS